MSKRYEIKDTYNGTARGMRFTTLERALREFRYTVGDLGRFQLIDRETGEVLQVNK